MNDPQRGGEARQLWNATQQARQEAAAYREVFPKPEEARTAAQRARLLDDIDRAYFAGDANQRAQLAAAMLREDPATFREMVFAGLRALEAANTAQSGTEQGSMPVARVDAAQQPSQDSSTTGRNTSGPPLGMTNKEDPRLAAYTAFERAVNEDLERSVGSAIARTIEQALPGIARENAPGQAGAQRAAPLQARLQAAVRQDVEQALKGDRQLGEQIALIISGRRPGEAGTPAPRFDDETRAQVVRLIGERARQLVPAAARRVINDWTQTALASHRSRSERADAASPRREVASVSPQPSGTHSARSRVSRQDGNASKPRNVDYRKLSDEQILDL